MTIVRGNKSSRRGRDHADRSAVGHMAFSRRGRWAVAAVSLLIAAKHSSSGFYVEAAVYDFKGANFAPWSDASQWSHNQVPTVNDEVWMNTADTSASISSQAVVKNLSVGRHAMGTAVEVRSGGDLRVGTASNNVLFVGQYDDAEGTVLVKSGAKVTVSGELAVAVNGPGTWEQTGGVVNVGERFIIGRYNNAVAVGDVTLAGGIIHADRFDMNTYSTFSIEGGALVLDGDDTNKVQQHIDAGRITFVGTATLMYDADAEQTYAFGRSLVYNYYGNAGASWSVAEHWQRNAVPNKFEEAWFNTADTYIVISPSDRAELWKLIVGRHVYNAHLYIQGGTLDVGFSNEVLFVGQYDDASGFVTMSAGSVNIKGELAVAVSGEGNWHQTGGTVDVSGRFIIGRYNVPAARGTVKLFGGTISASSFAINSYSTLEFAGGTLVVKGNYESKVDDWVSEGKISSSTGPLNIAFDGTRTVITSSTPPPASVPTDMPTVAPSAAPTTSPSIAPTPAPTEFPSRVPTTFPSVAPTPAPTEFPSRVPTAPPTTSVPVGSPGTPHPTNTSVRYDFKLTVDGSQSSWTDISAWNPATGSVPQPNDQVWMTTSGISAHIDSGEVATCYELIVARHVPDISLEVRSGAQLDVANSVLFVGQYELSAGTLVVQDNAKVMVAGELAISVSGSGKLYQYGGTIDVADRFVVGRYDKVEAVGYVLLAAGTLTASRFDMNPRSHIDVWGGKLIIEGNVESKVQGYISNGQIVSTGILSVHYDGSTTTVSSTATQETWDVAAILSMTSEKVGPRIPEDKIDKTAMQIREFKPAPPLGVHPRIFFGPEEIPSIRANLENTVVGADALKNARQLTLLMVEGRHPAYNSIPHVDRMLPDGKTGRVSNAGLFGALYDTYHDFLQGSCSELESQSGTHWNALGGVMAIEALDCLVFPDREGAAVRAENLGKAMAQWAQCALANQDFGSQQGHGSQAMRDIFGGQHMAFAYDLNYHAMTTAQRDIVRKGIAKMIWIPSRYTGITTKPYATTTNWVTINSFVPLMVLSIEGETTEEEHDWSTEGLQTYFRDLMTAHYKFFTYGWYKDGSPYEGSGKNYQYNAMMSAYAKRGYNFFAHTHVQAYARDFMPKQMQPFGNYMTSYDTIGGSGVNPIWGKQKYHSFDVVGVKWGFPSDPSVDFVWRNYVETPYVDDGGNKQTMLDVSDSKLTARSTYANSMLSLLMMASDYTSGDFAQQNTNAQQKFTFFGSERGLINTRSGFDADALSMNLHIRQDMGGHTFGDRNSFTLSALGRVWIRNPVGYIPETEWSSSILVNGMGITITEQDGRKARQLGRVAAHQDEPLATFTMGDATYAYNTEWAWGDRAAGTEFTKSGFEPVRESWNDFRSSQHQLTEYFGNVDFYDYAHWELGYDWMEGCVKKKVNDLSQFYRQAGLVRGPRPYLLIADDLHRITNSDSTEWQWIAQMAEDLNLLPTSQYAGTNLDTATDIVFVEASPDVEKQAEGDRRLLVRILGAEGSKPDGLLADYQDYTHDKLWYESGRTQVARRLIIKRVAAHPRFRVMLYPYRVGDLIPESTSLGGSEWSQKWGTEQEDMIKFHTATQAVGGENVEITGIEITRDGQTVIDTRGQAEPMEIRW